MAKQNSAAELLTQRILEGIPLADAMNFRISELGDHDIQVTAPLSDNINVHGTGFAGSLYSAATLSAWSLTTHIISQAMLQADVVMAKAEIRYTNPVRTDIVCNCRCENVAAQLFLKQLQERGRARLSLVVEIGEDSEATLNASMVASLS